MAAANVFFASTAASGEASENNLRTSSSSLLRGALMLPLSPAYFAFAATAIVLYWMCFRWNTGRLALLVAATKLLPLGFDQLYKWVLPLSLSFYCFQSLTYTIDLYRGTKEGTRSYPTHRRPARLLTLIVPGPINGVRELIRQLQQPFSLSRTEGGRALLLIATGL